MALKHPALYYMGFITSGTQRRARPSHAAWTETVLLDAAPGGKSWKAASSLKVGNACANDISYSRGGGTLKNQELAGAWLICWMKRLKKLKPACGRVY